MFFFQAEDGMRGRLGTGVPAGALPISLGVLTHALMKTCCDYQSSRFKRMRLRFTAPVYPGETIRTEVWRNGNEVAFRCKSLEPDRIVISNGYLLVE